MLAFLGRNRRAQAEGPKAQPLSADEQRRLDKLLKNGRP
jgi:hypothetical protein